MYGKVNEPSGAELHKRKSIAWRHFVRSRSPAGRVTLCWNTVHTLKVCCVPKPDFIIDAKRLINSFRLTVYKWKSLELINIGKVSILFLLYFQTNKIKLSIGDTYNEEYVNLRDE